MSPMTPKESILCTWHNIVYVVRVTSRYQSNLGFEHRIAMRFNLNYLRSTKDIIMAYGEGEFHVD